MRTKARDRMAAAIEEILATGLIGQTELAALLGVEPCEVANELGKRREQREADWEARKARRARKVARAARAARRAAKRALGPPETLKAAWARATVAERQRWKAGELTAAEIAEMAARPPPPVGRKPPGKRKPPTE